MTFGYSRDDAGKFLPEYVEQEDPAAATRSCTSTARAWAGW